MAVAFIGSAENSAINGGDVTVTMPVGTQTNDFVLVIAATGNNNAEPAISTSGYTTNTHQLGPPSFLAAWKIMGGSPDADVTVTGTGILADALAVVLIVFRGVDQTTPIDATTTTATGSSTNPDSPSITTSVGGAVVSAAASGVSDTSVTAPSGYSNQIDRNAVDTDPVTVGMAWKTVAASTAENPAAWTTWSTGAWVAISIALRAAATASSFNQIVTASLATSATKKVTIGKLVTPSLVTAATAITRFMKQKIVSATQPSAVTAFARRTVVEPITTAALVLSATVRRSTSKVVVASVASAVTLRSAISLHVSAVLVASVTIIRAISHRISASISTAAVALKTAGKIVSTSTAATASVIARKAFLKTVATSLSTVATLTRLTSKVILATQATSVSIRRAVSRIIPLTQPTSVTTFQRNFRWKLLTPSMTLTVTATAKRAILRTFVAVTGTSASVIRSTSKIIRAIGALIVRVITPGAAVDWPSDVPYRPKLDSYSEAQDSNISIFTPEVGPPKLRRKASQSSSTLTFTIVMSRTQVASFIEFYRTDLSDGTKLFSMIHPRREEQTDFKFAKVPTVKNVNPLLYHVQVVMREVA